MQFDDKKVCNFFQYLKIFSIFAAIFGENGDNYSKNMSIIEMILNQKNIKNIR